MQTKCNMRSCFRTCVTSRFEKRAAWTVHNTRADLRRGWSDINCLVSHLSILHACQVVFVIETDIVHFLQMDLTFSGRVVGVSRGVLEWLQASVDSRWITTVWGCASPFQPFPPWREQTGSCAPEWLSTWVVIHVDMVNMESESIENTSARCNIENHSGTRLSVCCGHCENNGRNGLGH